MYNELYETWRREYGCKELNLLPADFYARIASYFKKMKEEKRMLEKRSAKIILLEKEIRNAEKMLKELVQMRAKKIMEAAAKSRELATGNLAVEERALCSQIVLPAERFMELFERVRRGYVLKSDSEREHAKKVLRFLENVPSIIGIDMKTYGPFTAEDIASIPAENADALVKRKLAVEICISLS